MNGTRRFFVAAACENKNLVNVIIVIDFFFSHKKLIFCQIFVFLHEAVLNSNLSK